MLRFHCCAYGLLACRSIELRVTPVALAIVSAPGGGPCASITAGTVGLELIVTPNASGGLPTSHSASPYGSMYE